MDLFQSGVLLKIGPPTHYSGTLKGLGPAVLRVLPKLPLEWALSHNKQEASYISMQTM